jgi:hypothetical protein
MERTRAMAETMVAVERCIFLIGGVFFWNLGGWGGLWVLDGNVKVNEECKKKIEGCCPWYLSIYFVLRASSLWL